MKSEYKGIVMEIVQHTQQQRSNTMNLHSSSFNILSILSQGIPPIHIFSCKFSSKSQTPDNISSHL